MTAFPFLPAQLRSVVVLTLEHDQISTGMPVPHSPWFLPLRAAPLVRRPEFLQRPQIVHIHVDEPILLGSDFFKELLKFLKGFIDFMGGSSRAPRWLY